MRACLCSITLFSNHSAFDQIPPYNVKPPVCQIIAFISWRFHLEKFISHFLELLLLLIMLFPGFTKLGSLQNKQIHSSDIDLTVKEAIEVLKKTYLK